MNTWVPIEREPPKPDYYWTCTEIRSGPNPVGLVTVRYTNGEWRRWDGQTWSASDSLATHWYGEAHG